MIRLIACDLDGTLLQNGETRLQEELFPIIEELTNRGCLFAAASGRQYTNLQRLFSPVRDKILYICENGALIIYKNRLLYRSVFDRTLGVEVMRRILETDGCEVLLSGIHTSYLMPKDPAFVRHMTDVVGNHVTVVEDLFAVGEPYIKISAYDQYGFSHSEEYFRKLFKGKLSVVTSGNVWLDMIPPGVHKGNALKRVSGMFSVPLSETAAFGDNYNDLEMLRLAGYPVAMAEAKPEVKDCCRFFTPSVLSVLRLILEKNMELE